MIKMYGVYWNGIPQSHFQTGNNDIEVTFQWSDLGSKYRYKSVKFFTVYPNPDRINFLKCFDAPLTAKQFTRRQFFDAFLLLQLLVTVHTVSNATPWLNANEICVFG